MEKFTVIYENDEILIINKPCGVSVQGGKGISHPLDEELSLQVGYKIYLVHRLDKDTSGILIVAKNSKSAAKWTNLIGQKEVVKEYYAVCIGVPVVNGKICRKGKLETKIEAHGRLQSAVTFFEVEKEIDVQAKDGNSVKLSLIHLTLGTGRMHQLRIQLAKADCPIAADDIHGNFKLNKILRPAGIKKLQLCSKKTTIPLDGKNMLFEVDFPDHFYKFP